MNTLCNKTDYDQIVHRVHKLTADTKPQWGKMSVNEMFCHVADPFRDLLGMRETKMIVPFFIRPLAKMLLLSKRPFGKNAPTLKIYLQGSKGGGTKPTNFDNDKKLLLDLIKKLSSTDASFQFHPHPGVGKLSRDESGWFMWKHLDHHLKQFGV